jgi:hypothetical protein
MEPRAVALLSFALALPAAAAETTVQMKDLPVAVRVAVSDEVAKGAAQIEKNGKTSDVALDATGTCGTH